MTGPLVSVIMPNFNYAGYLPEAIDSVLAQDYRNIELIVVDDGSSDNSREVIRGYGDRVRPVFKQNGGQCSAFNAGFAASRGDIICFADSDDVQSPDKVSRIVDLFARHPSVSWVQHRIAATDANLTPDGTLAPLLPAHGLVTPDPREYLERVVYFITSGLSMRRELLAHLLPFPELDRASIDQFDAAVHMHNADAHLTALMAGVPGASGYLLEDVLGAYRRHRPVTGVDQLTGILEAHTRVEIGASRVWSRQMGIDRVAISACKHQLITGRLKGASTISTSRLRLLARGIGQIPSLAIATPKLAARQLAAMLYAFALPGMWLQRFSRRTGTAPRQSAEAVLERKGDIGS